MRILICDDEEKYLNELKIHIEEYMIEHFIDADFFTTTSSKEIMENEESYDLAFLDIQMPEYDGIRLAKALKNRNGRIILFFVTAFEEYQDEAMDLHIFRFFEKPFNVSRLYSSLDKAMEYIDEQYVDMYLFKNGEQEKILVDNILYIKRENRKIILTDTLNREYAVNGTLEDWADRLPNTFFYLVHKSFLVNLHYVIRYKYTELYLNGDIRIPIATRKQSNFHKYGFNYLKRR